MSQVQVLQLLYFHHLAADRKKCSIKKSSISYLGHFISSAGVSIDVEKISAALRRPIPNSMKAVRGFLGLTGYYRRFIHRYGKIVQPLTRLTSKDAQQQFIWGLAAQETFDKLKSNIISAFVLIMPDFNKSFEVECDVFGCGVGAVLMQ